MKGKIKFTMKCSKYEIVFLDTKNKATFIPDKKWSLQLTCAQKQPKLTSIVVQNHAIQRVRQNILIWVADKAKRNCSDKGLNHIHYIERLIENKKYLRIERSVSACFFKTTIFPISFSNAK